MLGGKNLAIADDHVVCVVERYLPGSRVLDGDPLDPNMLCVVDQNQPWTFCRNVVWRVFMSVHFGPPGFAVALHHSATTDRDALGVGGTYQGLDCVFPHHRGLLIFAFILTTQQRCPRFDFEGDMALQCDGAGKKGPLSQTHRTTTFAGAGIDSLLQGNGILRLSVCFGSISSGITNGGRV